MKSRDIRQLFFDYYTKHGHQHVASGSLVPDNDPTLLFTNAGMNQFKNLFLGLEKRSYSRAITSQKCVRAGGKHNDLENVGFTARHHTFFEMLGNFSFGDYFKKEAIHFAWELLTKELQIPKDRLYVTVFETDDEAADIWHKQEGVPRERIYRFGEKDNFWRMGDTGPCGPCSEIFYDHGPEADLDPSKPSVMGGDGDRYVEIWNNVFMQYNESPEGRSLLPKPSVDTGAGLERWAAMLQGRPNNYDTDLFMPIISKAAQVSKKDYVSDYKILAQHADIRDHVAAMRVLADHSRSTAFLIADGVLPSNEGRGYVLRRIMRREIRYARKLSGDSTLFNQTIRVVIDEMSDVYPELNRGKDLIERTVTDEITRFIATLDQGTEILNDSLKKMGSRGDKTLDGATIFKLYDTFGFPVDLTRLMASEQGFAIDETGFEKQMSDAREKAKAASGSRFKASSDAAHLVAIAQEVKTASAATVFSGYAKTKDASKIALVSNGKTKVDSLGADQEGLFISKTTPFYAESGGQAGDRGLLTGPGVRAEIFDCTKQDDIHLHHVRVLEGTLTTGADITLEVETTNRRSTANNHSATHLLHAALRKILGTHVTQAGSLVEADRLRFDFTHNKAPSREELRQIEDLVNQEIGAAIPVETGEMAHADAMKMGAMALFGEKYGDKVRVVRMGSFSTELCGGTHVDNTASVRLFKILSEGGVSAGVRRIEAVTGDRALQFLQVNTDENLHARETAGLQSGTGTVAGYIDLLRDKVKDLERELKKLKGSSIDADQLIQEARPFAFKGPKGEASGRFLAASLEIDDRDVLSQLADKLRDKLGDSAGSSVVCLVGRGPNGESGGKHPIIVTVSKDLTANGVSAGKILGEVAKEMGGKGGGRPDFAQGAGENLSKANDAFAKAAGLLC
ncbi:MAG: alanine--tRNA ligase [Bdellovibrionales bacterium]|jgi:alanyl-tRNA synthetase|nr:alanine--tRNA ligase [Bdellovibrionales bacterium]